MVNVVPEHLMKKMVKYCNEEERCCMSPWIAPVSVGNWSVFPWAMTSRGDVPIWNCITLVIITSCDMPYFDHTIGTVCRPMESKAYKNWNDGGHVLTLGKCEVYKAMIYYTFIRPAQRPLRAPINCCSIVLCMWVRRRLFAYLTKVQLFAIACWIYAMINYTSLKWS